MLKTKSLVASALAFAAIFSSCIGNEKSTTFAQQINESESKSLSLYDQYHNDTFRGNNITKYYDDGSLFKRIQNDFEDLYIGDYIEKNGITWRIAGFNLQLGKESVFASEILLTKPHICIVPDQCLGGEQKMSDLSPEKEIIPEFFGLYNREFLKPSSKETGYSESYMVRKAIDYAYCKYVDPVFGDHIMPYSAWLSNRSKSTGYEKWARHIDLMSSSQIGDDHWDIKENEKYLGNILPLFKLRPWFASIEFVETKKSKPDQPIEYWLRDGDSDGYYFAVEGGCETRSTDGVAIPRVASRPAFMKAGIRPYFYIY